MCSSSESCLTDGILRLLSPEPPPRAGQNSRVPQAAPPALGASPLLERLQNQQMVAASPGGRRGDRPASARPRASPLLAVDPAGVLERVFPAGGRDRGVVLPRACPEERPLGPP